MPYLMGSLFWQLNDCWPGISRSSTDYYGKKKALWYWLKYEYAMTLVSPVVEDKNLKVYIISDNLVPQRAELAIELADFSGKNLFSKSVSVEIPANKSIIAFDTALSAMIKNRKTNEIVLITTLKNGDQVISENLLYFDSPKNLDLKVPTIQKQVTEIPEGYKIEMSTDQLAKNVFLKMPFKGELSENYFDLIPGRTKTIIYTTNKRFSNILSLFKIISLADTY
jgi:beta-mannosidase